MFIISPLGVHPGIRAQPGPKDFHDRERFLVRAN
jgi:hypothetical protein